MASKETTSNHAGKSVFRDASCTAAKSSIYDLPCASGDKAFAKHSWSSTTRLAIISFALLLTLASTASWVWKESASSSPQIASVFLVRGPLPLAGLWEKFFEGQSEKQFALSIHGFNGNEDELPEVFQIASKTSQYGTIEIVDGERRLKAVALQDPRNTHFILICESASPLFCSSLGESFHATVVHSADLARTESPFLKSRKLLTLMAITQLSMVNSS